LKRQLRKFGTRRWGTKTEKRGLDAGDSFHKPARRIGRRKVPPNMRREAWGGR